MAVKLTDQIIPELPNFTFNDAFRTSQATATENSSQSDVIIDNIRGVARNILLPLYERYRITPNFINSWYRSPSVNQKVGGAQNSNHLTGRAVDISISGGFQSRGLNGDIFYFLWDYFENNSIEYDELLWEAVDEDFKSTPQARQWPQWVHAAIAGNGKSRKRVASIGVDIDFSNRDRGYGNRSKGASKLNYSNSQHRDYFITNIAKFTPGGNFSGFSPEKKAKFVQTALTYMFLKDPIQVDYITASGPDALRGTFMALSTARLRTVLRNASGGDIEKRIAEIEEAGPRSRKGIALASDRQFLSQAATALNTRKGEYEQFRFFYNSLNATIDLFYPSIKDPIALCLILESYFYGKLLTDFDVIDNIPSVTTDGSWLDYYIRANSSTPVPSVLRDRYSQYLNNYYERS